MDLGFGAHNQVVGKAAARVLLQQAHSQEKAVEDELRSCSNILSDDDALTQLRQQRLAQLQMEAQLRQKWKRLGHGCYAELNHDSRDVAKAFFNAAKESDRLVVHFYRAATRHCDVFHKHLTTLAHEHMEARFVKINVEQCENGGTDSGVGFLVEKLGIVVMPTVLIVRNRKAVHHLCGFDELGSTPDFSTKTLAFQLGVHDGIIRTEEEQEAPDFDRENLVRRPNSAGVYRSRYE